MCYLLVFKIVIKQNEIRHLSTMYDIAVTHAPLNWTGKKKKGFIYIFIELIFIICTNRARFDVF